MDFLYCLVCLREILLHKKIKTWKKSRVVTAPVLKFRVVSRPPCPRLAARLPVRNGNLDTDRTTTTKAASVRKQLGMKNSKSNEGRQAKNGGVKGRDRIA